jgi:hypothetical protein
MTTGASWLVIEQSWVGNWREMQFWCEQPSQSVSNTDEMCLNPRYLVHVPRTFVIPDQRTSHNSLWDVTNPQSEGVLSNISSWSCFCWSQKTKDLSPTSLLTVCTSLLPAPAAKQEPWQRGQEWPQLCSPRSPSQVTGPQDLDLDTLSGWTQAQEPQGFLSQPLRRSEVETLLTHCRTFQSGSQDFLLYITIK